MRHPVSARLAPRGRGSRRGEGSQWGRFAAAGVPDQPTVLFSETFENNPQTTVTPLTSYHGAPPTNETYKTDPQWAPDRVSCNGLITAFGDPAPYCVSATADGNVRLMARKLGILAGDTTPDDNHVCRPTPTKGGIRARTTSSNNVIGGRISSDGSILFSGSQLGVRLRNGQASGNGNDHAFDNILVSDASPRLDKAFGAASVTRGDATSLTFTVTNTAELVAKNGWSLTDNMPAARQVATPNGASTNCPGGVVTTAADGQSIKATGNLATGQRSCTVTVNVLGAQAGVTSNGANQLTTTGLREPAQPATVRIAEPTSGQSGTPACSDGKDNDADEKIDRADSGCVFNGVYLSRKNSEASITPLAECARGDLRLTDVYGLHGRTVLRGVAGPRSVGAKVTIFATSSGKRVATTIVGGDLSFSTTAALPQKAIRSTNAARFQARLARQRSLRLKFARRMTATVARLGSARVRIGGRVTAPLARPTAAVVVRASSRCPGRTSFRGPVVARGIRVQRNGRWAATITLPPALRGTRVFLRAATNVRKTARNPKRFATFSLIQGVALP
jgi:hypothetical protein